MTLLRTGVPSSGSKARIPAFRSTSFGSRLRAFSLLSRRNGRRALPWEKVGRARSGVEEAGDLPPILLRHRDVLRRVGIVARHPCDQRAADQRAQVRFQSVGGIAGVDLGAADAQRKGA